MSNQDNPVIGVGIVGAGVIGNTFADVFVKNKFFSIAAVCDVDENRAISLAAKFQGAKAFTKLDDLIQDPAVGLVYVGVPPAYHATAVLGALRAGKHVLCEKPIALNSSEAEEMAMIASEAAKNGIVSAINYPMNFVKGIHEFRRHVAEGYLGELKRVELRFRFPDWPRKWQPYTKKDWINTRESGGVLREIGSHFYFAVLTIFGIDAVVQAKATIEYPKEDPLLAETSAQGCFKLKTGQLIIIDLLTEVPMEEDIKLIAYGTNGSLSLVDFQFLFGIKKAEDSWQQIDNAEPFDPKVKKLMDSNHIVNALAEAINNPTQPSSWDLVSLKIGLQVQRLLDALLNSNSEWVDIKPPL